MCVCVCVCVQSGLFVPVVSLCFRASRSNEPRGAPAEFNMRLTVGAAFREVKASGWPDDTERSAALDSLSAD